MQQQTYVIDENLTPEQMAAQIAALPAYQASTSSLEIVFSPSSDREFIRKHLAKAREVLPNTTVVGITTMGHVNPAMHVQTKTVCSLLMFESCEAHVDVFDCHEITPDDAGHEFARKLHAYKNAKAVFCTSAYAQLDLDPFIRFVSSVCPTVPLFGTMAGTQDMADDQSIFFAGEEIFDCGILTVTFCGENLEVKPAYNLGWHAIGNEHIITNCDRRGLVRTIDDEPALNLFQRYLKIAPDDAFFDNTCSFPLVTQSGKHLIARVPIGITPEGGLRFPGSMERGAHVRFSYAHPDQLMRETRLSANDMGAFEPQALLLFSCLNRRVFLGNERAEEEIRYYRNACPHMAWAYGFGEILMTSEGGGHLNSTIVALGLREGAPTGEAPEPLTEEADHGRADLIPLSERLATLLEATTNELNETIAELEVLAKRDPLTGAVNRRRMDEVLHYELSKRRTEEYLALLMYDIDFFKSVNDTFGHDTGDVVLKDLTRCVQGCIRAGDTLGRWGGEEFLVLLTGLTLEDAQMVAERIRQRVEETPFLRVGKITISIGLTAARLNDTPDTFFQRVDQAMYDAKHAGRNCVRVR